MKPKADLKSVLRCDAKFVSIFGPNHH
jgi:hypothetical protein